MSTTLYLSSAASPLMVTASDFTMGKTAPSGSVSDLACATAAGGGVVEPNNFVSGGAPVGGCTISGAITFYLSCRESSMSANAGISARLYKRAVDGTLTQIGTDAVYGSPTEMANGNSYSSNVLASMTMTPASPLSLLEDERLLLNIIWISAGGAMASGYSVYLSWGSASTLSRIVLTETIAFKSDVLRTVGYRARNDDGSETAATWMAPLNTDWTQDVDTTFRLRFQVRHLGPEESILLTPLLQCARYAGGAWGAWQLVDMWSSVVRVSPRAGRLRRTTEIAVRAPPYRP
jgi:hypothetical protein